MSATKAWLMEVQAHPAYQEGYDACRAARGRLEGRKPPEDREASFAYKLGWDYCLDDFRAENAP